MTVAASESHHALPNAPASLLTVRGMLSAVEGELAVRNVADPARGARIIAAHVLQLPTAQLDEASFQTVTIEQAEQARNLAEQTSADAPVAYLVGSAPFFDLDFIVTRDTLIPKRDTELFLDIVFAELAHVPLPSNPHVLELCCGSGCVAVTLAKRLEESRVVATDISEGALHVARQNIARHDQNGRITLGQGDLWAPAQDAMGNRLFDLIVSNPPYIPTENIPGMGRHVADHEPYLALNGGADGLDPHRRILADAPRYLTPDGRVFLEHEYYQGEAARRLAESFGTYIDIRTFADANGKDRALYARLAR